MDPAVDIRELSVTFPSRGGVIRTPDRVSIRVDPGQVVGFLGPNGAGKTTTMRVILGFVRPSAGSAIAFHADVCQSTPGSEAGLRPSTPIPTGSSPAANVYA